MKDEKVEGNSPNEKPQSVPQIRVYSRKFAAKLVLFFSASQCLRGAIRIEHLFGNTQYSLSTAFQKL